jgi:hypothetical protein
LDYPFSPDTRRNPFRVFKNERVFQKLLGIITFDEGLDQRGMGKGTLWIQYIRVGIIVEQNNRLVF